MMIIPLMVCLLLAHSRCHSSRYRRASIHSTVPHRYAITFITFLGLKKNNKLEKIV